MRQVITGFGWSSSAAMFSSVVALIKIIILARLLTKFDIGLISLTTIALGVIEATTETGVNVTILQSKKKIEYFLDTAWVIAIARGVCIAIIMIVLAFFLQEFFEQPELLPLISLAALIPVIKGFINPSIIVFYKQLRFGLDTAYRSAPLFLDAIMAVTLAYFLRSAVAIPLAMIIAALFEVTLSFILSKHRPKFRYQGDRAKVIFKQARSLSLSALLSYLNENADNFSIGKLTGVSTLGVYDTMYKLGHKLSAQFAKSFHYGALPVMTQISDNQTLLRRTFWRTITLSVGLSSVIAVFLILFAQPLIAFGLGETWLEGLPLIKWLVLAGVIQSLSLGASSLLIAKKRYFYMNFHGIAAISTMIILIVYLTPLYGIEGSAAAIFFSRLISLPIILIGCFKVLYGKSRS